MHHLDGCCPHLRLAVSDRVEDSSREYDYMVNVIGGTEGSALKAPLRNLPHWPRLERRLGRRNDLSGVYLP